MVLGLPYRDTARGCTVVGAFDWCLELKEKGTEENPSVLVLDDLAEAGREMQAGLLTVVADGQFSGFSLPHTAICATANPEDGKLDVKPSLANRVIYIRWAQTPSEFADLAISGFNPPPVPRVRPNWQTLQRMHWANVGRFCDTLQEFHEVDRDRPSAGEVVGPFPTPRSWTNAAKAMAALDCLEDGHGMDEMELKLVRQALVEGAVGRVAAAAFFMWEQNSDLPKPAEVLANPGILSRHQVFGPANMDRAWFIVRTATRYAIARGNCDIWRAAWRVLDLFAEHGMKAVAIAPALALEAHRPDGAPDGQIAEMAQFADELRLPQD